MGGDLNLKKSWHPHLLKNQERVWQEEKKALEERKRIDQWKKERAEERGLLELRQIQEAAGGKKVLDRVDFLYSGPTEGSTRTGEEMEAYLLGKRRIDSLLTGTDNEVLKKGAGEEAFLKTGGMGAVAKQRDTVAKVREDPLLAIKRREMEAYRAFVEDPTKKRKLLEAAGVEVPGKEKKHRSHRHRDDDHRSSRRHRSRSRDDDGHKSSRRHRSRSRDRKHRRRSRSSSPRRDRDRDSRRDRDDRSYRRSSPSPRRPRKDSPSPPRRTQRDRSRSPVKADHSGHSSPRNRRPSPSYRRPSPPARPTDSFRRPSPPIRSRRPTPPQRSERNSRYTEKATSNAAEDEEAERARKLAAMQSNASELDADRTKRLAALAEREKEEAEKEEADRLRNKKYGGRADFLNQVNKKAAELDLGERVSRGRQQLGAGKDEE